MRWVARAPQLGPYEVRGATVVHPDGTRSALIVTGDLDLESLEQGRRASAIEAFARLCRTLDAPLQLVVRVRTLRAADAGATRGGGAGQRERAMRRHWEQRLRERPAHARTVYVAVRGMTEPAVDSRIHHVRETLHGSGVSSRRLAGAELAHAVADGLRVGLDVPWKEYAHHLEVGTQLVRGFALRRLPGHPVSAGWLGPLLRVGADCDIAIHIGPAALSDALSALGRGLRNFTAHRMLESERGLVSDAHVELAMESAFTLRDRLARNLGRPLHLSVTACVRAGQLDQLHRAGHDVRTAFDAALVRVEPAHFRHLAAFMTTLPVGRDALGIPKLVDSGSAATCFPWVDAGGADPDGYRLGMTIRSGLPVRLDPFDTGRHTNANIAVLATSGHGKSFAIGALVIEAAERGVDSVVVDPEGEYSAVVEALGGRTLRLAPGGAAVNVFDTADQSVDDAADAVVELANVLCGGVLSDVERAHVDAAARAACDAAARVTRTPLLSDCLGGLEQTAPRVAVVLRRFCTGALGQLFDRETTARVDAGICNISLRDLPDEHVAPATLILARWLWHLVRVRSGRRHIIFDEVGALCTHVPLRSLLVQLARRCRKHGVSLVVATQNAQDLLATDEGRVVATNCATALLGGQRAAETAVMASAFGLTAAQGRFLETAGRGEFLLLAGDRRTEVRIDVPPLHRSILEGGHAEPGCDQPLDGRVGASQDMGAPGRSDPKMWDNEERE